MSEGQDGPAVERWIAGALRSTIAAHGPITKERTSSAAKRIRRQLESIGAAREPRTAARALLAEKLRPVTQGDAGVAADWLLDALADAGLSVVETASLPTAGVPARRIMASHHPGSKEQRTGRRS